MDGVGHREHLLGGYIGTPISSFLYFLAAIRLVVLFCHILPATNFCLIFSLMTKESSNHETESLKTRAR